MRPYRYLNYQKDDIEKIVRELLTTEVLQPIQSPYSSPVLLVTKADGSWHFCVDYRALNKATIKNIYPTLVVGELLDVLCGSMIFSIDLKSGYHQIRVKTEDIPKATFRPIQ